MGYFSRAISITKSDTINSLPATITFTSPAPPTYTKDPARKVPSVPV